MYAVKKDPDNEDNFDLLLAKFAARGYNSKSKGLSQQEQSELVSLIKVRPERIIPLVGL